MFGHKPDPDDESAQLHNEAVPNTLVFNSFVFAQIFTYSNSRRIDRHTNVFEGIFNDHYSVIITVIGVSFSV
jgi:Ca2+-transporting ATPase